MLKYASEINTENSTDTINSVAIWIIRFHVNHISSAYVSMYSIFQSDHGLTTPTPTTIQTYRMTLIKRCQTKSNTMQEEPAKNITNL